MDEDLDHVILYHGTCSAFEKSIFEHGFVPAPETRASADQKEGSAHLVAFEGTYAATERDTAAYYAKAAASQFGGEPRIAVLRVPVKAMVPDEDEVHFTLGHPLAVAMGFGDHMRDGNNHVTGIVWDQDRAKDALLMVQETFGMSSGAVDEAVPHLHRMIDLALQGRWGGDVMFFHPDGSDMDYASPNWVRNLMQVESGPAIYREEMAKVLETMRGAPPYEFPAGFESFKGRITDGFGLAENENGVFIIGFGTLENPFSIVCDFSSYRGDELSLDPDFVNAAWQASQPRSGFGG
jgi:hypothetical protein